MLRKSVEKSRSASFLGDLGVSSLVTCNLVANYSAAVKPSTIWHECKRPSQEYEGFKKKRSHETTKGPPAEPVTVFSCFSIVCAFTRCAEIRAFDADHQVELNDLPGQAERRSIAAEEV